MTRTEIARLVYASVKEIDKAFRLASTRSESIKYKCGKSYSRTIVSDYTLEETLLALKHLPKYTPMLEQYVRDNFIVRSNGIHNTKPIYAKYPDYIESFVYRYKQNHCFIRCCANCMYLNARSVKRVGRGLEPYCSFYSAFINRTSEINVYKDRCKSWKFTNRTPFIFLPGHQPQNMNVFHRQPYRILGIKRRLFTSKKTPSGEEPVILQSLNYAED